MRALKLVIVAIVGIAGICSSTVAAPGDAPSAPAQNCPSGYWLSDSLCMNSTTGDVVLASSEVANEVVRLSAGCRTGYERMATLCYSARTGDVELADDNIQLQGQQARATP